MASHKSLQQTSKCTWRNSRSSFNERQKEGKTNMLLILLAFTLFDIGFHGSPLVISAVCERKIKKPNVPLKKRKRKKQPKERAAPSWLLFNYYDFFFFICSKSDTSSPRTALRALTGLCLCLAPICSPLSFQFDESPPSTLYSSPVTPQWRGRGMVCRRGNHLCT